MQPAQPKRNRISRYAAFTLMELIVTMALAAIVLTLGVSSFQRMLQSNQAVTTINGFVGALNLARSEAIKRGLRVTLCKSIDKTRCADNGGYEQGWVIFVDSNNNAMIDPSEAVLQVFDSVADAGMTLIGNSQVNRYISYVASGNTKLTTGAFQAGTLTLCTPRSVHQIVVNPAGRVRTTGTGNCP
ncbi:MAG: GspH/FimT family pseudopilin [Candidatus Competibacter denitrificans]